MLSVENAQALVNDYAVPWGINIAMALAIFIVGRLVIKLILKGVGVALTRAKIDQMLVNFILSVGHALLLLMVIVASLNQLGVDTTSLVAILGAAGLAIGLSLQDSLKNFAAGVMLIVFRPFRVGDYVEAGGVSGVVEGINLFTATLMTVDNREVIVPNGAIYSGAITNYSRRSTRRVDMVFGIGYEADLKQAKALLETILAEDPRVLKDPAPVVAVAELADSSVNFVVRPWVASADYFAVLWDTTEAVKLRFDEAGISIPFPQMDVHLHKTGE